MMDRWLVRLRTPLVFTAVVSAATWGSAHAAARLVLTSAESQVSFFVDGTPLNATMGGGQMKTTLTAGPHIVQVRDVQGEIVYSGQIDMPSNAEVKAEWSRLGGLRITSPAGLADPVVSIGPAAEPIEQNAAPADDPALGALQDDRTVNQSPAPESRYAGGGENLGRAARVAGDVVTATTGMPTSADHMPGQGNLRQQAAGAAISGTTSMVRNACAGGLGPHYGPSSDARQGRPTPVAAFAGTANFVYQGTDPVKVFADGALVADFSEGAASKKVKLEVGYHEIEVRGTGFELLHHGMLNIEKDFTVDLAFGPGQPAAATNRSWVWSPR